MYGETPELEKVRKEQTQVDRYFNMNGGRQDLWQDNDRARQWMRKRNFEGWDGKWPGDIELEVLDVHGDIAGLLFEISDDEV